MAQRMPRAVKVTVQKHSVCKSGWKSVGRTADPGGLVGAEE